MFLKFPETFYSNLYNHFYNNNINFAKFIIKDELNNIIEKNIKFDKLIKQIEKEIQYYLGVKNIFNPALKNKSYTKEFYNTYSNACMNISILCDMQNILLSSFCTQEMYENIEENIFKIFKIKYNENMQEYLP